MMKMRKRERWCWAVVRGERLRLPSILNRGRMLQVLVVKSKMIFGLRRNSSSSSLTMKPIGDMVPKKQQKLVRL